MQCVVSNHFSSSNCTTSRCNTLVIIIKIETDNLNLGRERNGMKLKTEKNTFQRRMPIYLILTGAKCCNDAPRGPSSAPGKWVKRINSRWRTRLVVFCNCFPQRCFYLRLFTIKAVISNRINSIFLKRGRGGRGRDNNSTP